MAGELHFGYVHGMALYAIILDALGRYWNHTLAAFETFNQANWTAYAVPLGELGTGATGQYGGDFPPAIGPGVYAVELYVQAGGGPALGDGPPVGGGRIEWDGGAEIALAELVQVPALFGTISATPTPTASLFTVKLAEPLDPATTAASFMGLWLTPMPGGVNGAPAAMPISTASIVDPLTLTVALNGSLPLAPAPGDPVAISD